MTHQIFELEEQVQRNQHGANIFLIITGGNLAVNSDVDRVYPIFIIER